MTSSNVPMPFDPEGRKTWHNDRGLPWGSSFDGPGAVTMAMMQMPGVHSGIMVSLSVHLANEHGVSSDKYVGTDIEHALAHQYGRFRPGQEHYHATPGADMMNPGTPGTSGSAGQEPPETYHVEVDSSTGPGGYGNRYSGTDPAAALAAYREAIESGHEYVILESLRERPPGPGQEPK